MFFWLKKLLGYWIMPVPFCVALFGLGLVLLMTKRRARAGRALLAIGVLLFLAFSHKTVSAWLVRSLETRYPPIAEIAANTPPATLAGCQFVVVLGAGNGNTPGVAALNELSTSARGRITEAVRLLRALPDAKLLVSGPADESLITHATVLERAAASLGIEASRIERIEHARDTEDESLAVKHLVGDARVALVTSAWHMPRSAALFRAAQVNFVPCPTDYCSHSDGRFHWRDLIWDVESLERSSVAVRERVGYVWIWLRGKTRQPKPDRR